jgi:starvation-inducible outer membrane lipoprotein
MRYMLTAAIPVLVLGLAGCADTPESGEKLPEVTSSMVRNPDEVTCRNVVRTGTRIGTKKCMTNQRWMELSRDARQATQDIQRQSNQQKNPSGG